MSGRPVGQRQPSNGEIDGGWGWVIVSGSFLNHFLFEGTVRSYGLLYLFIVDRYNSSAVTTAWIQALFNTIAMATGPLVGLLIERTSCRVVVMSGGLLLCLSFTLSAYSPSHYFLFFSYSLIGGCGGGLIYSPMVLIVSQYFHKKRGIAMGLATLGGAIGTATLPPIVECLLHYYGYSGCLLIMAGIMLNHLVSGSLYYRSITKRESVTTVICDEPSFESDRDHTAYIAKTKHTLHEDNCETKKEANCGDRDEEIHFDDCGLVPFHPLAAYDEQKTGEITKTNDSLRYDKISKNNNYKKCTSQDPIDLNEKSKSNSKWKIIGNVSYLLFCFNLFNIPATIISTFIFLPGLAKEKGIAELSAAFLVSIIGAASACGRLSFGFIFDIPFVVRHRRLLHSVIAMFLGIFTLTLPFCPTLVWIGIVCACIGIAEGGTMAQRATALSQYVPPNHFNFAFGVMTMCQGLGNLIAPLIQGLLRDKFQTYMVCFWYGGVVTAASSLILIIDYTTNHFINTRIPIESDTKPSPI